jgi:methionine-rich copper-binding protein CopC
LKNKILAISILSFIILISNSAFAHEPIRELETISNTKNTTLDLNKSTELNDPTEQSLAIYGALETPTEVDLYSFTLNKSEEIPIEVLVPVRVSNENFKPSYAFISTNPELKTSASEAPFEIPDGYFYSLLEVNEERDIFFEPFSIEKLYNGNEEKFSLNPDQTYYVAVYEPNGYTGDYSLGIGTVENFEDVSFIDLLKEVFLIKLGVVGNKAIPWLDIVGLFLFIAGMIIGLGAVTVIDIHGFLGRKSKYWTAATVSAHKVTKPLIWAGITMATIGASIYYRLSGLSSTATFHLIILVVLILNGLFLSFKVSPFLLKQEKAGNADKLLPKNLQRKITVSFLISFTGWWSGLFLLVWHLLIAR